MLEEKLKEIRECLRFNEFKKAEEFIKQLSDTRPDDYILKMGRAQNLIFLGRIDEAERLYNEVSSKAEEELQTIAKVELLMLYKKKGDVFYINNNLNKARDNYYKALHYYDEIKNKNAQIEPCLKAMVAVGNIALAFKEYGKARLIFNTVLDEATKSFNNLKEQKDYNLDLINFLSEAENICNKGMIGAREQFYNPSL